MFLEFMSFNIIFCPSGSENLFPLPVYDLYM